MTPVTLECEYCGSQYERVPSAADDSRFCSRECMYAWRSENHTGEDSPLSKEKIGVECGWCGDEVFVKPSLADGRRFCSYECMGKARSEELTGADNPFWGGGTDTHVCEECGTEYEVTPARSEKTSFCSPACRSAWLAKEKNGQNSPHWTPGSNVREEVRRSLPRSWRQIREEETGEECEICGATDDLQLHHIIPLLAGGTHHPDNLLTVCVGCHNRAEAFIKKYTQTHLIDVFDEE